MRAGPMRHRFSVQQEQVVKDGAGGHAKAWMEVRKLWAETSLPGGRTEVVAHQITALVTVELLCRPAAGLVAGLRLVRGVTTYKIEAALPDNKGSMLRLLCSNVPHP